MSWAFSGGVIENYLSVVRVKNKIMHALSWRNIYARVILALITLVASSSERVTRARFLSLAPSKLRLRSANHRPGYWNNLSCNWPSTAWAYSEQETENGPWYPLQPIHHSLPIRDIMKSSPIWRDVLFSLGCTVPRTSPVISRCYGIKWCLKCSYPKRISHHAISSLPSLCRYLPSHINKRALSSHPTHSKWSHHIHVNCYSPEDFVDKLQRELFSHEPRHSTNVVELQVTAWFKLYSTFMHY